MRTGRRNRSAYLDEMSFMVDAGLAVLVVVFLLLIMSRLVVSLSKIKSTFLSLLLDVARTLGHCLYFAGILISQPVSISHSQALDDARVLA